MRKSRHTDSQIVKALEETAGGRPIVGVCRKYGISNPTYHAWGKKYGGKSVSEVREIRKIESRLGTIYRFLNTNRCCNLNVQENYYKSVLSYQCTPENKVVSLLYNIANTQSKPNIDNLAKFYQDVFKDVKNLGSFEKFVKCISRKEGARYKDLYEGLLSYDGWGPKTSALFTKAVFQIHSGKFDSKLRFWDDAPREISEGDQLYLPVDAVIIALFKEWGFKQRGFSAINKQIGQFYTESAIEVWDDLWFWGFITQHGSGDNRVHGWNRNKYWILEFSNKDPTEIKRIKQKADRFVKLLK